MSKKKLKRKLVKKLLIPIKKSIAKKAMLKSSFYYYKKVFKKIIKRNANCNNRQIFAIIERWLLKSYLFSKFLNTFKIFILALFIYPKPSLRHSITLSLHWFSKIKDNFRKLSFKINPKNLIEANFSKKVNSFINSPGEFVKENISFRYFLLSKRAERLARILRSKTVITNFKINRFLYFLKLQMFFLLFKGKSLIKESFSKFKSLIKPLPFFFFNRNKMIPAVNKDKRKRNIPFKYKYHFSVSPLCNEYYYKYFENRWKKMLSEKHKVKTVFVLRQFSFFKSTRLSKIIEY